MDTVAPQLGQVKAETLSATSGVAGERRALKPCSYSSTEDSEAQRWHFSFWLSGSNRRSGEPHALHWYRLTCPGWFIPANSFVRVPFGDLENLLLLECREELFAEGVKALETAVLTHNARLRIVLEPGESFLCLIESSEGQ